MNFNPAHRVKHFLHLLLLAAFPFLVHGEGEYVLNIGEKSVELSLGVKQMITLTNGQKLSLLLSRKDVLTYQGELFSFRHKSEYAPSRSELGDGLHQTLMSSALGTVIIVQEYPSTDPSTLVDYMAKELTKEELKAGYTLQSRPVEQKLADGTVLKGKSVVTTSKAEQWTRTIVAHGTGEGGLLIVTMIEKDNTKKEQPLIDLFWSTLRLKPN
jgi:hypothetical protein